MLCRCNENTSYTVLCLLLLYFDLDVIGHQDIFFCAHFAFFHTHVSLLTSFIWFLSYFILAVPMRKCLGKCLCMNSLFPIAILNGTFFFCSVKAMNNWKQSAINQILLLLLLLLLLVEFELCFYVVSYIFRAIYGGKTIIVVRFIIALYTPPDTDQQFN